MRIIAGQFKGKWFEQPKTAAVRPLGEKVRAALFDAVGDVAGWTVLDAYAGSGAAGFEALSRGAARVDAVEQSRSVAGSIRRSAESLGIQNRYRLFQMPVGGWLKRVSTDHVRYNMVVADPPYERLDVQEISQLGSLLQPTGILVLSHASRLTTPELEGLVLLKSKRYGDATLSFYMQ